MKKRQSLLVIAALTLCMSLSALPTTVNATEVDEGFEDIIDDEEEEGEQTTIEAPDADTGSTTGGSSSSGASSSGGGSSTGSSGTTSSSSSATKSSDSSLSRLSISPGTLSPSFSAGTYSYTASVDANVKRISVGAKPNNAKAVIAAVTGAKSLTPGSNTVKVVVEAENGATSTYTITVNCGTATAAAADQPADNGEAEIEGTVEGTIEEEQPQEKPQTDKPASEVTFDSNGYLIYRGEAYVPAEMMPEGQYVSLEKYNKLYEQSQSDRTRDTRIIIAFAVVLVLLLIVVINLILRLRDAKIDAKLGITDDDDEDDVPVRKRDVKKAQKKEKAAPVAPAVDTGMIPDVKMPDHMKEEVHKKPKARPKKNEASASDDDIEILDLNDL